MFDLSAHQDVQWHFDFDGTLFYSHEALVKAYSESVLEHNGLLTNAAEEALIRGESYRMFLNLCSWRYGGIDLELVRARKNEIYLSNIELIQPNSGLIDVAKSLYPNISIVTSSSRVVVNCILAKFNLLQFFQNIVTSDDVLKIKPDPEPYLKSISRHPQAVHIAIEDSELGAISAKSAGLVVLRTSNFSID
jgi:putative hydrolase of the HAD superfamily